MTGISPIGSVWPTQASINTKPTLDLKAFTPDGDTVVLSEKASDEIRSQFGKADSSDKHLTPGTQAALAAAARGDYYWTDSSGGRCFSAITTLTKADKELVKNATGWDINADPEALTASEAAKSFAGRLNLDRYSEKSSGGKSGTGLGLDGEVTSSYLQTDYHQRTTRWTKHGSS